MKILGIDTTRTSARVFLMDTSIKDDIFMLSTGENIKHSEGLFLFVEKIMIEKKISVRDIDSFACIVGPGSFTGIRVGMSTIKGLNKALKKSILSINGFELLSNGIVNGYIVLNSTHTSCYYAKIEKKNIVDMGVIDKSQITEMANGQAVYILDEEQNLINLEYNNIKIIENLDSLYVNSVMNKLDSGVYGEFVPFYLQLSQAERNLKHE